ncbi:SGNH/GDSL hydrolase family protein [Salinibacterium hongtaonis]|uniref:SGNH/GDSL hydrolase family protein n=1 Tax=Homoserinimonas hongtaonis TaxID=2079791 RepID=A0A2U1T0Y2_9MICO|nr:SGNH/GDSL hydrolase family protein [Salinibacterium hongtaonis]PWB97518.1 SGNH/GDSL hydrolase family protein [Salinibacterium hongtaonis]
MRIRTVGWAALATALVAAGGALATTLVQQRRIQGMERLAQTIPVNSKYWRDRAKKKGELLYVALGDSAAQGIGSSKPQRGYVGEIARMLRETTGRSVRVVNLSASGARLREAIEKQLPALAKLGVEPDVVTVGIGANDIGTWDPARFEREIEQFYSAIPAHSIVGNVPSFYVGRAQANVRVANELIAAAAQRHGLSVAPVHRETHRLGMLRYALNQVSQDFFHPNDRGYRAWINAFLPLVERRAVELVAQQAEREADAAAGGVGGLT